MLCSLLHVPVVRWFVPDQQFCLLLVGLIVLCVVAVFSICGGCLAYLVSFYCLLGLHLWLSLPREGGEPGQHSDGVLALLLGLSA